MFFIASKSTTNIIYGPFFREPAAWPHLNRSPPQGPPVSRGSSRSADRPWRSWLKHLWFPNGLLFKLHPLTSLGALKWHPMDFLRRKGTGGGWSLLDLRGPGKPWFWLPMCDLMLGARSGPQDEAHSKGTRAQRLLDLRGKAKKKIEASNFKQPWCGLFLHEKFWIQPMNTNE